MNKMLQHFPRHRWVGGQDCIRVGALLTGTHNLGEQVVPVWVKKVKEADDDQENEEEDDANGYQSEDEAGPVQQQIVAAAAGVPGGLIGDSSDFLRTLNRKMNMDCRRFFLSHPRPRLFIMAIAGNHFDKLIKSKIFLSGAEWSKMNDKQTILGFPRKYKLCEKASNKMEMEYGRKTAALLHVPSAWAALPQCICRGSDS